MDEMLGAMKLQIASMSGDKMLQAVLNELLLRIEAEWNKNQKLKNDSPWVDREE
jgi:hypothetical protein